MTATTKELLQARFAEVKEEIAAIEAKSAPLRAKRNDLQEKVLPLESEMRTLQQQIRDLEMPELNELKAELSVLAKALGAKSMKADRSESKTGA